MFSVSRSVQFLVAKFSFQSWFFSFCFCWLHSFHVRYKNLSLNHFLNRFCFKVCLCLLQLLLQLRSPSLCLSHFLALCLSLALNTVAICRSISPEPTMQHYLCATVFSSESDKVETQPENFVRLRHTCLAICTALSPSLSPSLSLSILSTSLYICGALCLCSYSLGLPGGRCIGGGTGPASLCLATSFEAWNCPWLEELCLHTTRIESTRLCFYFCRLADEQTNTTTTTTMTVSEEIADKNSMNCNCSQRNWQRQRQRQRQRKRTQKQQDIGSVDRKRSSN